MNPEETSTPTEGTVSEPVSEPTTDSSTTDALLQELIDLEKSDQLAEKAQNELETKRYEEQKLAQAKEQETLDKIEQHLAASNKFTAENTAANSGTTEELITTVQQVGSELVNFKEMSYEANWLIIFALVGAFAFKTLIDHSTRW